MTPGRRPDHDLALLALQEFYKPYLQRVRAEAILPWGHRASISTMRGSRRGN